MTITTDQEQIPRYEDFGHPASWYRVAWSSEVAPGDVKPLRYFGRNLVLYRTSAGMPVVLDAYCQHLGAHLGHGGVVRDDCIVCPFHGWTWRPDGTNERIPYSDRPTHRTIPTWTVREASGIVWVWYSPDGGPPTFELPAIPELDDGSYTVIDDRTRKVWSSVRVHPLQAAENTADAAHIRYIHGAGVIPDVDSFSARGPVYSTYLSYEWGAGKARTWLTPDGPVLSGLNADCHGLGLIVTRYSGIWPTIQLTGCTPIEGGRSDFYTAVAVKVGADDEYLARLSALFFAAAEADFPIWANMRFIEHPPLPRLESQVMRELRAWSRQFTRGEVSVAVGS